MIDLSDYEWLSDGEDTRGICPVCDGGSSREKSLSVRREGPRLLYKCWRMTCPVAGMRGSLAKVGTTAKKGPARLTYSTIGMPADVADVLSQKYALSLLDMQYYGWRWTNYFGGRVVIPVKSRDGRNAGFVLRALGKVQPKVLNDLDKSVSSLAWVGETEYPRTVFVVEDAISATCIAACGGSACALLGTHITPAGIRELRQSRASRIVIALDPDAIATSVKLSTTLRSYTDAEDVLVIKLRDDFHKLTVAERLDAIKANSYDE